MNDQERTRQHPSRPIESPCGEEDAAAMDEAKSRAAAIASAGTSIVMAALSQDSEKFLEVNQQQNAQ